MCNLHNVHTVHTVMADNCLHNHCHNKNLGVHHAQVEPLFQRSMKHLLKDLFKEDAFGCAQRIRQVNEIY